VIILLQEVFLWLRIHKIDFSCDTTGKLTAGFRGPLHSGKGVTREWDARNLSLSK